MWAERRIGTHYSRPRRQRHRRGWAQRGRESSASTALPQPAGRGGLVATSRPRLPLWKQSGDHGRYWVRTSDLLLVRREQLLPPPAVCGRRGSGALPRCGALAICCSLSLPPRFHTALLRAASAGAAQPRPLPRTVADSSAQVAGLALNRRCRPGAERRDESSRRLVRRGQGALPPLRVCGKRLFITCSNKPANQAEAQQSHRGQLPPPSNLTLAVNNRDLALGIDHRL